MAKLERFLFALVQISVVVMPWSVLAGFYWGGIATFVAPLQVFGFYFLIELVLVVSGLGIDYTNEDQQNFHSPTWLLYAFAISQILVVTIILGSPRLQNLSAFEFIGVLASMGVMCGSAGGLTSHEFIHRKATGERLLGILALSCVNYGHFYVSHVRGHHRDVGLTQDWSTARRGETCYGFMIRGVSQGWLGAWQLDRVFMTRYVLFQCFLFVLVGLVGGVKGIVMFIGMSVFGTILMELVNYLSHYGITRDVTNSGRPTPIRPMHSWDSPNKVSNWFIFNGGKHGLHHMQPTLEHQKLMLSFDRIFLPYGLPLMTLIALVPPIYFRLMHPLLDKETR